MSTLKLKSAITMTALCALSLASAAAFAGGRMAAPMGGHAAARASMPASSKPVATTTSKAPTTTRAAATTRATGQPNASCEDTPNQPGHSISAPGSAFNPDGTAGTKYAGEQLQNSKNPNSVSQYDVACTRPQH